MSEGKDLKKIAQDGELFLARISSIFWRNVVWSVFAFLSLSWFAVSLAVFEFEKGIDGSNIKSLSDALWWGIVTFLTVGYGDKYPITEGGRVAAGFLMISGVASTGIITAKISSLFLERALRDGRGLLDTKTLNKHIVVCGWNESMEELLLHILDFNTGMKSDKLVIIANTPYPQVDSLRNHAKLKDLHFIPGDHFAESNLRRTALERAQKVLILADRSPSSTGQLPTPTEVDARTIMAAMTIANIARGTLVTAEILDPKMDHYLKLAQVSEIIYSSEYSRLLLGNATSSLGIANIVFDLLDIHSTSQITSTQFPSDCIGKKYSIAKEIFEQLNPTSLVIGVLENSGNSQSMKELALRRAQKTPNVAQLVANLQTVKELRCNNPNFNPPAYYEIPEGSMAIVIAKKERMGQEGSANVGTAAA